MEKKYVLFNLQETIADVLDNQEPVFWNNNSGWGNLATAQIYDNNKQIDYGIGVFVELPNYDNIDIK